MHRSCAKVV